MHEVYLMLACTTDTSLINHYKPTKAIAIFMVTFFYSSRAVVYSLYLGGAKGSGVTLALFPLSGLGTLHL